MDLLIINRQLEDKTGGSELQCDIIARRLQQRGHRVSYLALNAARRTYSAPYRVVPLEGDDPETVARTAVRQAPDLIYWRYNIRGLAAAAEIISRAGIPILFSVSNRNDLRRLRPELLRPTLSPRRALENLCRFRENLRNHKGLFMVDGIANQCLELMGRIPGVPEIHFPNSMRDQAEPFGWPRPYCAWVSSLKDRKRPEAFVRLVRRLNRDGVVQPGLNREPSPADAPPADSGRGDGPEASAPPRIDFLMAGEIQDRSYDWLRDASRLPANLHYLGPLSVEKAAGLIRGAMMLIHTCRPEGFPNNFIQAWHYGRPVVSLEYDPDGLIEKEGLGFISGSFGRFRRDVARLIEDEPLRAETGGRAAEFARQEFDADRNISRIEAFMKQIVKDHP